MSVEEALNKRMQYPNELIESFWENENKFWHIIEQETGNEYLGFLNKADLCCEECTAIAEGYDMLPLTNDEMSEHLQNNPVVCLWDINTGGMCVMSRKVE